MTKNEQVEAFKQDLRELMYKYNISSLNAERDGDSSSIHNEEITVTIGKHDYRIAEGNYIEPDDL